MRRALRQIYVFVKPPAMGRVKTRLAAEIGPVEATWFYRRTAAAILGRLARDARWRTIAALDAGDAGRAPASAAWPPAVPRVSQGTGDIGQRMARILAYAPPGPAIIVGSDIPGLTAARVERAFCELERRDVVIGPSPDGGYWLIGLKRLKRFRLAFDGVRWSSRHALDDTLRCLPERCDVGFVDELADVDDAADWRKAMERSSV